MEFPSYILLTAAHNEEEHIGKTIRSVLSQTVLPKRWLIINDGSSDNTVQIIQRYASSNAWIQVIHAPPHDDRHFAAKANCISLGYRHVENMDFDIIGNMDADISFDEDYCEYLLEKFVSIPGLGVAGTPYIEGSYRSHHHTFSSYDHVPGQCQLFRRKCFEDIGGYLPLKRGGIDVVAVISARINGWATRTFDGKYFTHHRNMGTGNRNVFAARFRNGENDYILGNHFLWQSLRFIYQMKKKPYILGGLLLYSGYIWALLRRKNESIPREIIRIRQYDQIKRLKSMIYSPSHK